MRDPVLTSQQAVKEAKRILKSLGYLGTDCRQSPYFGKVGMMDRKIRVSDHPHDRTDISCHREDILVHIVFQKDVPRSIVQAEVERAHKLFEEVRASRRKS